MLASWVFTMFYAIGDAIKLDHFNFDSGVQSLITIARIIIEILLVLGLVKLQQGIITDLIGQTKVNYEIQDEFNQILSNLEESIVIFQEKKAKFVNERFLLSICEKIIDHVPDTLSCHSGVSTRYSFMTKVK